MNPSIKTPIQFFIKVVLTFAMFAFMIVPAQAHLVTTGLGPVYDGIVHFWLSPEDLLVMLALAFYAGLCGPDHGRIALFALPCGWFVGGVVGALLHLSPSGVSLSSAATLLVAGSILATEVSWPLWTTAIVTFFLGEVRGALTGQPLNEANDKLVILGICLMVFIGTALLSSCAVPLRRAWMRIVLRVLGSWVAALGLLMFGWALRFGS